MNFENRSSLQTNLDECLEDTEAKNTLLGFFDTLLEIAKENPEIIQVSPHLQSLEGEDKKFND